MGKEKHRKTQEISLESSLNIKDWHAVLVISLAALFFFRDIIFQKAYFWEDFLYYFYPVRNLAAVSMSMGELPLWNPFTFSGMPFQADIQSAIFYIPNLLLTFFVSGGVLNFYWVELQIIFHYIIAGVCMYHLAKSYRLANHYALFSGLVFMLSGFMIMHAIHQVVICQVAWFPLVVLFFKKALEDKSFLYMIIAGLILGHAVLSGYPQVTLYIFLFLFLFFLFELFTSIKEKGIRYSLPLIFISAGMMIIAIGFTAIQLLPTQELAPLSERAEISYDKSLQGSLSWERLITLVIPKFFGTSSAAGSTFWLQKPYWEFWETCIYLGIAALILTIIAITEIKRNRNIIFFFGIAIFAILYALGDDFIFHKLFFFNVPQFDKFRNPARMSLLLTFAVSLLSGFGLRSLFEMFERDKKKLQQLALLVLGFGIIIWLAVQLGVFQPQSNSKTYNEIHGITSTEATTAIIFFVAIIGIILLWIRSMISAQIAFIALLAVQFIDMNIFGFSQNNSIQNPEEYFSRSKELISFIKQNSEQEFVRINSRKGNAMILDRNQGMIDRIYMMEGYTPLALQRIYPPVNSWDKVCDLLNAKYRVEVNEQQRSMNISIDTTYLPRAFVVFDAKIIPDEAQEKAFMGSNEFNPRQTIVLRQDPQFPVGDTSGSGTAAITSYHMNTISLNVSCNRNGYLVLSEIYYPGWKAYVDGAEHPIYCADWNLRSVPIKSGNHRVEIRYEPSSFRNGLWISLTTLGISTIGIVYLSLGRKKKQSIEEKAASR